jgi:hypothetical protein
MEPRGHAIQPDHLSMEPAVTWPPVNGTSCNRSMERAATGSPIVPELSPIPNYAKGPNSHKVRETPPQAIRPNHTDGPSVWLQPLRWSIVVVFTSINRRQRRRPSQSAVARVDRVASEVPVVAQRCPPVYIDVQEGMQHLTPKCHHDSRTGLMCALRSQEGRHMKASSDNSFTRRIIRSTRR